MQDKVKELSKEGYRVVIIGKANHPEVVGIKAHADLFSDKPAIVISPEEDIDEHLIEIEKSKKIGIVIQTTQLIENLKNILPTIMEHSKELKIYNTICPATNKRQSEAKALAKEVDLMVVVGSKLSANTAHLTEILSQIKQTIHVETEEDLDQYEEIISKVNKIGITAGASTPEYIINNVINKIGD